jgi:hypothetical protein
VVSFTPWWLYSQGESPRYPLDRRLWVSPRAGLDDVEKRKFLILPVLELRPLGCPARSQSQYRLSYSDSSLKRVVRIVTTVLEEVNEIFPGMKSADGQTGSPHYPSIMSRCASDTNMGRSFNVARKVDSPWDSCGARYDVVCYSRLKKSRVVHKSYPPVNHFNRPVYSIFSLLRLFSLFCVRYLASTTLPCSPQSLKITKSLQLFFHSQHRADLNRIKICHVFTGRGVRLDSGLLGLWRNILGAYQGFGGKYRPDPEDGVRVFLRNIDIHLQDYTVLKLRTLLCEW